MFATVAGERGIELRTVATDLDEPVPGVDEVGGVIVMGGPWSVSDAATRPHLADEIRLLADATDAGLPVMAVCLGAQLLASGLGAGVAPAREEERGMRDVALTDDGAADPVLGPEGPVLRAFQYHGETLELPAGAASLATSAACPQQAFRVGDVAYGLRFPHRAARSVRRVHPGGAAADGRRAAHPVGARAPDRRTLLHHRDPGGPMNSIPDGTMRGLAPRQLAAELAVPSTLLQRRAARARELMQADGLDGLIVPSKGHVTQ